MLQYGMDAERKIDYYDRKISGLCTDIDHLREVVAVSLLQTGSLDQGNP